MSIVVLGTAAVIPQGTFDLGTAYKRANIVFYQGQSYMAMGPVQGILPTNETYWMPVAEKGETGTINLPSFYVGDDMVLYMEWQDDYTGTLDAYLDEDGHLFITW